MSRAVFLYAAVVAGLCGQAPAQEKAQESVAQRAAKHYATAMSQYNAGQLRQALQLLDQFVQTYDTHEYVPGTYMLIADCRKRLKDMQGYEQALDEVIKRFYGSGAWFKAYVQKLELAKRDPDEYLGLLESLGQRAGRVPLAPQHLAAGHTASWHNWQYSHHHVNVSRGHMIAGRGWIADVLLVANTPDRAQKALEILERTLQVRKADLPVGWQYAHVHLLKAAGKTEEADRALREYKDQWGDDPRGMSLWMFEYQDAQARKDVAAQDEIYKVLIDKYGGCASLERTVWGRVHQRAQQGRYDEFVELADYYLKTYANPAWNNGVFSLYMQLAQPAGEDKTDTSRIAAALAMLERAPKADQPGWQRTLTIWKIDLLLRLGEPDEAAKLAEGLLAQEHWAAATFAKLAGYASRFESFKPLVEAARQKWSVPELDPKGDGAAQLKKLRAHLRSDQVRHAEEMVEDMFADRRGEAATIRAVYEMATYYYRKVLREPRQKWADRMTDAYPYHPLTQTALVNRIRAARAEKRPQRAEQLKQIAMERFPAAYEQQRYEADLGSFVAGEQSDLEGRLEYVVRRYGALADAGSRGALDEIAKYKAPAVRSNHEAMGDFWVSKAEKLAGTRAAIYCLCQAWQWYLRGTAEPKRPPSLDKALAAIRSLQAQTLDPEVRWKLAFEDINLLVRQGKAKEALDEVNKRLGPGRKHRQLRYRLDLPGLGSALVRAGLGKQAMALVGRLKAACRAAADQEAIEVMLAQMHLAAQNHHAAGQHYLNIVANSIWPITKHWALSQALSYLAQARSPAYAATLQGYIDRLGNAQDLVPPLLHNLGSYYLGRGDPAALRVRARLADTYPSSAALDRLDARIAEARQRHRKKR